MKPRLLDLFCGAGGCSVGYARAGFEVVGVDVKPQEHYPFEFFEADAMEVAEGLRVDVLLGEIGARYEVSDFDAVHASPPCQAFTSMRHMGNGGEGAIDLLTPIRPMLVGSGLPYVIENVIGAPMVNPVRLCGSSFGLNVWRHRLFETNFPVMAAPCAHHLTLEPVAVYGDHPEDSRGTGRVRRARSLEEAQEAMGIDWMPWVRGRQGITQAIPPAYTEHIGSYLLAHLEHEQKAAA